MKWLSIDWDICMDYSKVGVLTSAFIDWVRTYNYYQPEIRGVRFDADYYEKILELLAVNQVPIYVAEDHGRLYNLIKIMDMTNLEIVSLDAHHDCYKSMATTPGCENWLGSILKERLDTTATWIHGKDERRNKAELAECTVVPAMLNKGGLPYLDTIRTDDFDAIFICRSDHWSPPHLDHKLRDILGMFQSRVNYIEELYTRNYREMLDLLLSTDTYPHSDGIDDGCTLCGYLPFVELFGSVDSEFIRGMDSVDKCTFYTIPDENASDFEQGLRITEGRYPYHAKTEAI